MELEAALVRLHREHPPDLIHQDRQLERILEEFEVPRFNPRKIQHFVQQPQQRIPEVCTISR